MWAKNCAFLLLFKIVVITAMTGIAWCDGGFDSESLQPGYIPQNFATYDNWLDPRAYLPAVPGEVLVKLKDVAYLPEPSLQLDRKALKAIEEPILNDIKRYYELEDARWVTSHIGLLRLPQSISIPEAIEMLQKDPLVEYVQPNYYRRADLYPNDPHFVNGDLWGLKSNPASSSGGNNNGGINMPQAWDQVTDCSNVVVAVIDTGVDYLHPELSPNIWHNEDEIANNGIDDDENGYIDDLIGWDMLQDDNDPLDHAFLVAGSHGSHVAGTIGAVGNNSKGIAGICWKVQIMPLRILDMFGFGTEASLIEAIDYATENGADVINLSLGGPDGQDGDLLFQALNRARDKGILVAAAAGNEGARVYYNNDRDYYLHYPSSYELDNIVAVAANLPTGRLTSFSNYGEEYVDLAAPGTSILSTTLSMEIPEENGYIDWTDMLLYDENDPLENYWTDDRRAPWFYGSMDYFGFYFPAWKDGWGYYAPNTNGALHQIFVNQLWNNQPLWDRYLTSALITQPIHLTKGADLSYGILLIQWSLGKGDFFLGLVRDGELKHPGLDPDRAENYNWSDSWDYVGVGSGYIDIQLALMSIEKYVGKTVQIAFCIISDAAGEGAGVYIFSLPSFGFPAFSIESISFDNAKYIHDYYALQGTSMATPHVSGVAALMKAKDPDISPAQIRQYMIESVTPGVDMEGMTVSGGILNAAAALEKIDGGTQRKAKISVEPQFIDFGDVNVGKFKELQIKVANDGDNALMIMGCYVEDDLNYSMRPSPNIFILPHEEEYWRIRFHPKSIGAKRTNLVIQSSDPDNPEIKVPMRGVGVSLVVPL